MKNEQSDTRLFMQPWSKMANRTSLLLILPNRDVSTGPKATDWSQFAPLCRFAMATPESFRDFTEKGERHHKRLAPSPLVFWKWENPLSDENQQL